MKKRKTNELTGLRDLNTLCTPEPKFPHAPSFALAPFMSINPSDGNNLRGASNIYNVLEKKMFTTNPTVFVKITLRQQT